MIAYVVPLRAAPRFQYIPVERYSIGDTQGRDVPHLRNTWSIPGRQRRASVKIPSHRQPSWVRRTTAHFEIFYVRNLDPSLPENPGIADLGTVPPLRVEFIIFRRTDDPVLHALDVRLIDTRKIDVALTKYVLQGGNAVASCY